MKSVVLALVLAVSAAAVMASAIPIPNAPAPPPLPSADASAVDMDMDVAHGAAVDSSQEFELDANGKPHKVVAAPKAAAAAAKAPLSRAEVLQRELNEFDARFERDPNVPSVAEESAPHKPASAKAAAAHVRFAEVSVDAQAEAESQAQTTADLAIAIESHMEAAALAEASAEATAEVAVSSGVESQLAMEVDAEMDLALAMETGTETSPAAKVNENYACYRWARPPRLSAAARTSPFAPREGHASWLSKNGKSLYTFGGCDRQTLPKNCYGELKQMDVKTRVWRNRKILGVIDGDKDVSLHMQGAAQVADPKTGRRLFVFGGLRVDATDNSAFSNSLDLLYYDKRQKEWSWTHVKTTGDHPPPSQDATLVMVDDHLILFGGYSDIGFFNDVYTIRTHPNNVLVDEKDPNLWKWQKLKVDGPAPPARRGHSMTLQSSGGSYRGFVFGGVSGTAALNDMYVLAIPNHFASPPAPKKGSAAARALASRKGKPVKHWSWMKVVAGSAGRVKTIPSARAHHASLVVRPRHLLIFGGSDPFTNHWFDDVLLFNTRTMTWLPTPPSLVQSTLAPVFHPKAKAAKKGGKVPVPAPPPQSPKRRFPAWNPSARKKLTVTLLPNKNRVMVVGGCDRAQCFGDVYEMDLKGVCIDSCGEHGRFVDYRVPTKISRRKSAANKKGSFLELAAEHTQEQAEEAYAQQFEESDEEDSDEDESETESEESEVIDEEEEAESQMLEQIEMTAEEALESTTSTEDDDTIEAAAAAASGEVTAFIELEDGKTPEKTKDSESAADANLPPTKMKLIRKKGGKKSKKDKKSKLAIKPLLSKLSLETLKELNKERSFDAKCMCRDGYTGRFCQKKGACHLNCSGQKRGLCVTEQLKLAGGKTKKGSSYCVCSPGFWGLGCQYKACKNNCSSHGICVPQKLKPKTAAASAAPASSGKKDKKGKKPTAKASTAVRTRSVCKCEAGFWGKDCSLAEEWRRPALEKQNCVHSCSGMGRCTNNYTMSVPDKKSHQQPIPLFHTVNEFNLHPLNRPFDVMSVDPRKIKDPKKRAAIEHRQAEERKKRAEQMAHNSYRCACRAGYGGEDCAKQCPLLCSRHGHCNGTGQCECDSGWTGAGCDIPTCGEGDHCTYHGKCDQAKSRCKCDGSFRGPACDIDIKCSGHGQWIAGSKGRRGHCKCNVGWFLEDCSLQLKCPNDCAKKGRCILKGRKAARMFKPLSRTATPPHVKGQPETTPPPLPRVVAGTCICAKGFQSSDCSEKTCPKACNRHGECVNGQCRCYPGYSGTDCGTVLPCLNNCTDATHGACRLMKNKVTKLIRPKCKCKYGWSGKDCSQLACPKDCSHAGKCFAGQCKCNPGVFGADCSIHCPKGCSGHGECQSNGRCTCDAEYTGADCSQRKSCPSKSNAECSGHGICHIPSATCHCEPGFSGKDCSSDHSSCHNNDCSGHGACSFGKCFCQIGYSGEKCEFKTHCINDCNHRGICNMGKCECNPGWAGEQCSVQVWDNTCPGGCNNHGLCSKGVCSCIAGWTGNDCNTVTDFCKNNNCNGRGTCVYNKCECLPGTSGAHCEHGSTCPAGCDAKHGVCLLGTCHCLPGFTGPTCTQALVCPGASALGTCTGHGVCLSGTCACEPGWGGADCSMPMLPEAMTGASCQRNCSGAGVCHLGKCFCVSGYGGVDCSITYNVKCPNDCSGHAPRFDQRGICHLGRCLCHPGYSGESCQNELKCPAKCSVNGVCAHGHCFCVAGWTGPACDWPLRGNLKPRTYAEDLKEVAMRGGCGGCSMHGLCIDNKCVCEAGYGGPQCADVAGGVISLRCPNNCAGNGLCLFGKCFCNPGFTGAGCEKAFSSACPNDCKQKGICRFGKCFCYPGFGGDDCSAIANCDAQCGVHGVCLDGRCVCADGFSGEQCNIASRRNPNPRRHSSASSAAAGAGTTPASFIDTASSAESIPTDEIPHSFSELGAITHTTNSAPATANKNNAAAALSAAGPVTVTNYSFPLLPVTALAFVLGAVASAFAKCIFDKREQMRRQEQLISPLLQVQN